MALNRYEHYEPRTPNMFLLVENEPEGTCRTVCRDDAINRSSDSSLIKQMKSEQLKHKIYIISGLYRAAKRESDHVEK
jgi:hypothetical protein